jgi:hypothetical protein
LVKICLNKVCKLLTIEADIPYMDNGFAQIGSAVISALNDAVGHHIIALPTRARCTREQAASRIMPDILWQATIEGAVHKVVVNGVLAVNLITGEV